MKTLFCATALLALGAAAGWSAEAPALGTILDQQVRMVEHEVVPLAEAMPEEHYQFAPTHGEFSGVRTFAQQVAHVAAVVYLVSAAMMEQKPPVDTGGENGPASLKTKADYVKFLKDSFAYAHKAVAGITDQNAKDMVPSPFGSGKVTRVSIATIPVWHTFDHYGQMVVYARMNGVVPGGGPPAAGKQKQK